MVRFPEMSVFQVMRLPCPIRCGHRLRQSLGRFPGKAPWTVTLLRHSAWSGTESYGPEQYCVTGHRCTKSQEVQAPLNLAQLHVTWPNYLTVLEADHADPLARFDDTDHWRAKTIFWFHPETQLLARGFRVRVPIPGTIGPSSLTCHYLAFH